MKKTKLGLALGSLLMLTACGAALERVASVVPGLGALGGASGEVPEGFDPNDIAANPGNYVVMSVPQFIPQPGVGRIVRSGGGDQTIQSQYGFTAAYENGFLVGTRGLPGDLMGASIRGLSAALRNGGGSAERTHDYLDSLNQIQQERFNCEIVYDGVETVNLGLREAQGRKFTETCRSNRTQFENAYWLGANGEIIASRQFISVGVAYLRSNQV